MTKKGGAGAASGAVKDVFPSENVRPAHSPASPKFWMWFMDCPRCGIISYLIHRGPDVFECGRCRMYFDGDERIISDIFSHLEKNLRCDNES